MTLTITSTEAKEELAKLHDVKPNDVVIITNEQNLDASFFTNLKAGQKLMAIKIVREVFGIDLQEAKNAVENFTQFAMPK